MRLNSEQEFLSSIVKRIIHHIGLDEVDEVANLKKKFINLESNLPLIKTERGSVQSLILESFLNDPELNRYITEQLKKDNYYDFLISSIIVDTNNFDKNANKIKIDEENNENTNNDTINDISYARADTIESIKSNIITTIKDKKDKGLQWSETDRDIVKSILDICKNSIFLKGKEQENPLDDPSEYKYHFNNIKNNLINVKFNSEKNLKLGLKALFNKDKKISNIYAENSKKVLFSFGFISLTVNVMTVFDHFGKEEIRMSMFDFAEENQLHLVSTISYDKKDDHTYLTFYIKRTNFITDKIITNFINYLNDNECNKEAICYKDDSIYIMKVKGKKRRKTLITTYEKYLTNNHIKSTKHSSLGIFEKFKVNI